MQVWLDRFLLLVIATSIVAMVITAIALMSRVKAAKTNANLAPASATTL